MKKFRVILCGAAILLASGAAVAKKISESCLYATQYYYNGSTYVEAGIFGQDFSCLNLPGVCSYYEPDPIFHPGVFMPCHMGQYFTADVKDHSRRN